MIVFGRNEQQSLSGRNHRFESFDRDRLNGVIVLIVEREIADSGALEGELSRGKFCDCSRKFSIQRIAT